METPETEEPPLLPESEAPEEHVDVTRDLQDTSKLRVTEEDRNNVANGFTPRSSPSVSPSPSSAASPLPRPRSGLNGSVTKDTTESTVTGESAETVSPYINGGIINKRYSYSSGSMVSESMDLSIHKGHISAKVSENRGSTSGPEDITRP